MKDRWPTLLSLAAIVLLGSAVFAGTAEYKRKSQSGPSCSSHARLASDDGPRGNCKTHDANGERTS